MDASTRRIWIGVGSLAVVAAVILAVIYLPRLWAEPVGRTEQIVATNTGAYRTQAYEKFYDLYEQIEATDQKLSAYPAELDDRQRTECVGLLSTRANLVSEYNAASRAEITTGQWQAPDLPSTLEQDNPRTC